MNTRLLIIIGIGIIAIPVSSVLWTEYGMVCNNVVVAHLQKYSNLFDENITKETYGILDIGYSFGVHGLNVKECEDFTLEKRISSDSESLNKKWGELYLEYQFLKESFSDHPDNITIIERMAEIDDETMRIATILSEREFTIDVPEKSNRNVTFDDPVYPVPWEIDPEPEPPTISDEQDQMIREYCETGIRHPDMMGIPQCVKEPDCGSNTFLNEIGVCEVLDNGCKPDAYGNFYDCKPHYDYWKILFSSPIALLVVFGTPSLIAGIVIGVIIWRKRK